MGAQQAVNCIDSFSLDFSSAKQTRYKRLGESNHYEC